MNAIARQSMLTATARIPPALFELALGSRCLRVISTNFTEIQPKTRQRQWLITCFYMRAGTAASRPGVHRHGERQNRRADLNFAAACLQKALKEAEQLKDAKEQVAIPESYMSLLVILTLKSLENSNITGRVPNRWACVALVRAYYVVKVRSGQGSAQEEQNTRTEHRTSNHWHKSHHRFLDQSTDH